MNVKLVPPRPESASLAVRARAGRLCRAGVGPAAPRIRTSSRSRAVSALPSSRSRSAGSPWSRGTSTPVSQGLSGRARMVLPMNGRPPPSGTEVLDQLKRLLRIVQEFEPGEGGEG